MKFEKINSERKYNGRAFDVRKDELRTPDGKIVYYDVVDHVGSVSIVPVDDDGNILFVRQFRHAVEESLLELPAGTLEFGESFEVAALREIREEVGMQAGSLTRLGAFYLAPGYSTEMMEAFLATELTHNPLAPDEDEYLSVEKIPVRLAYQLVDAGKILDGKSLAALLLVKKYLGRFL